MRHDKPNPSPDPPSPHRQTFPGLSDTLDRLAEVAGYHPEFDDLRARLDELTTFAPLVRLHARGGLALSAEAVRLLGLSPPAKKRRIAPESAAVGVGGAGEKRGGSGRSASSQSVQRCGSDEAARCARRRLVELLCCLETERVGNSSRFA